MSHARRFLFASIVLCCVTALAALPGRPVMTATAAGGNVRFLAQDNTCQMRVQIIAATGETFFDSAWRDGNVLDWPVETQGQPLTSGSYHAIVSVKDLEGQVTSKEATLVAASGRVTIEQSPGAEAIVVTGTDGNSPRVTLLAHDGEKGELISTVGDLSFRFGNLLTGNDTERMHLTADGKLGIGTSKPQAPLDVNGIIRTSRGIEFPDGTILTSAAGLRDIEARERSSTAAHDPVVAKTVVASGTTAASSTRLVPGPRTTPSPIFTLDASGVYVRTQLNVYGAATFLQGLDMTGELRLGGQPFAHAFGNHQAFFGMAGNLTMVGGFNTGLGYAALAADTSGQLNTATGNGALAANTTGSGNVANGNVTLNHNTSGGGNAAVGYGALFANISGDSNTAMGEEALSINTTGYKNTASGTFAMRFNSTGAENVASGDSALFTNSSGNYNTASGYQALYSCTGSSNVGIGSQAGSNLTTGGLNIDIFNLGVAGESSTIRIGTDGLQTRTFVAGIRGVTTGGAAIPVLIDANGQLGTASSSRRYKFDIADIGDSTDSLMRLRPVTFRYRAQGEHAPLQYGLIAEEVADVYPELIARNASGQVETVMYQFLAPMLLNEVQKQHRQIERQQTVIDSLNSKLEAVVQRLAALEQGSARSRE
jgi:hypothetical protein